MRIEDSGIIMGATRSFSKKDETQESVRVWVDPQTNQTGDRVSLSHKVAAMYQELKSETENLSAANIDQEVSLKKLIVEILVGHKIKIVDPSDFDDTSTSCEYMGDASAETQHAGWGLQYDAQALYQERETVAFMATGVIKTRDGQELAFNVRLDMTREFMTQRNINIRAGDAALMDPLVINYDGDAATLTSTPFVFDIDSDGTDENLPLLMPGRGFLALDQNNDGMINNGQELFGPNTGNGFEELAVYDTDGNQWIDEADEAYSRLSILTVAEGQTQVQSLSSHGIGAIYLGNLAAPFDLRGSDNDLMGRISRTGLFLREDGTPGTIQHLDIRV